MKRILPLTLVALAFPAVAQAAPVNPALVQASVAAAQQVFPDNPCNGRLNLVVDDPDMARFNSLLDSATAAQGFSVRAISYQDGSCRIIMGDSYNENPMMWCKLFVHEYGHLNNLSHSEEGIMAPVITPDPYEPCSLVLTPAWRATRARLIVRKKTKCFRVAVTGKKVKCPKASHVRNLKR